MFYMKTRQKDSIIEVKYVKVSTAVFIFVDWLVDSISLLWMMNGRYFAREVKESETWSTMNLETVSFAYKGNNMAFIATTYTTWILAVFPSQMMVFIITYKIQNILNWRLKNKGKRDEIWASLQKSSSNFL